MNKKKWLPKLPLQSTSTNNNQPTEELEPWWSLFCLFLQGPQVHLDLVSIGRNVGRCHISRSQFERWSDVKLWIGSLNQATVVACSVFDVQFCRLNIWGVVLFFKNIFLAFVGSLVEKTWSWDTVCVSIRKINLNTTFRHILVIRGNLVHTVHTRTAPLYCASPTSIVQVNGTGKGHVTPQLDRSAVGGLLTHLGRHIELWTVHVGWEWFFHKQYISMCVCASRYLPTGSQKRCHTLSYPVIQPLGLHPITLDEASRIFQRTVFWWEQAACTSPLLMNIQANPFKISENLPYSQKHWWNPISLVVFLFWKKNLWTFSLRHTTPTTPSDLAGYTGVPSEIRVCLCFRSQRIKLQSKFHCTTVLPSSPGWKAFEAWYQCFNIYKLLGKFWATWSFFGFFTCKKWDSGSVKGFDPCIESVSLLY